MKNTHTLKKKKKKKKLTVTHSSPSSHLLDAKGKENRKAKRGKKGLELGSVGVMCLCLFD
jgi:hypothetical protein